MRKVWAAGMSLMVLALTLPMCTGVPLTAPSNASITLRANPTVIPANGGVSVITAVVIEPAGTPVPNGTIVFFVSDLGRVDSEAKTKDGIARVYLVSDSRSGVHRWSRSKRSRSFTLLMTPLTRSGVEKVRTRKPE